MRYNVTFTKVISLLTIMLISYSMTFGDEKFDELIKEGNYKKAIEYANKNIPSSSRTVDIWIKLGKAHEKAGSPNDKILTCFKNAQKANPSEPNVYIGLANCSMMEKKYADALKHYQRAYILKRSAEAAEGIAITASKLRNWEKARDAAESAIALDKEVIESRLILTEIYKNENDYKGAAEQLEVIVKKKPTTLKYWKRLALCYEKSGQSQKLKDVDPHIIKLDKKNVKSRQRHADYLMAKKDINAAYPLFKELAILTPNNPKVFQNLYQIAKEKGQKNDAILYVKNYLALDSSSADYHRELGDLLYDKKDHNGALNSYRRALRMNPNAKGFFKKYEKIVLSKGLTKEAIKVINAAIAVKEADAESYIALGDIYKGQKKYVSASSMYQEALKTDLKNIKVLSSLADCQAKSDKISDAVLTYEQVILLNPKATIEHKILADLQRKLKKTDKAMEAYQKYLNKVPSDYNVAKILGFNAYDKKDYKKAIEYLEMVKDTKERDTRFLVKLGNSYYQLKKYKKSAEIFSKVRDRKVSVKVMREILKPLGDSYEKIGNKIKAADAYSAYTKISGVKDADASYLKAYLREDTEKETAIKIYESNIKIFTKDHRNFLRLGLIYSKEKETLLKSTDMLNKASLISPKDPVIWRTLGVVYGKLKNENRELDAYKKFLAIEPQNLEANRRVGMILLKKKMYKEAIVNLEIVSTSSPKDVEVFEALSEGYMNTKRPEKAIDLLEKSKNLKPDKVEIRIKLIEACTAAKKTDQAAKEKDELAKLDNQIITKDNKNIKSRVRLADYAYAKKDLNTAYKIYQELASLTPKDKVVFKRLNEIALKNGKKVDAIAYLRRYLALDPKNAKAHVLMGNLLYEQNDHNAALESFRTAIKLDPDVKGFYKHYGNIVVNKGLEIEAIDVLNKAITRGEADAKTYNILGGIYQKRKNYPLAIKMFQKASEADPKNSSILASLAECQSNNDNIKEAIITYEQVILINPNAKAEYRALGDLKMKQNKKADAIKTYIKYLEKVPGDSEIAKTVGLYQYDNKKYEKAIKYFEMVKASKLKDVQYLSSFGLSYYRVKKYAKAIPLFESTRNKKPDITVLKMILKPLAVCYEETKMDSKAADTYLAYTKLDGVIDAEASFKKAFLREKTDTKLAITLYSDNIKKFSKDHRNFLQLGLLYSKNKSTLSQAATMLNKASILKPDDAKILVKLGKVYGDLKNEDKELLTYQKLLKLEPQNLDANKRVGLILLNKKKYTEAIVNLEIVSTMMPKDVQIMLALAQGYMETKRNDKAIDLLEKAKRIKKNDPEIGLHLYKLYKQTGKQKQAESEIKELIALTKDNKLRIAYTKDLIDQRRYGEANQLAQQIKKSDPTNVESLMLLGKIQQKQNKLDEAIETYKMISFINENYAPALYERGNVYLLQNNNSRAKSYFDRAVKSDPKFALGYLGLAKVAKAVKKNADYNKYLNKAKSLDPNHEDIVKEIRGK